MGRLEAIDHVVLVAGDVERTVSFYIDVLGGEAHRLEEWRRGEALYPSVLFGTWKLNVHPQTTDAAPRAAQPLPGTADLCLRFNGSVADAVALFEQHHVPIEHGPAREECATAWTDSIYVRDPDGCLVELACPIEETGD